MAPADKIRVLSPVLSRHPGLLLNGFAKLFGADLESRLEPLGLKTRHLVVLQILSEEEHPSQARVGARLRMDRTTMVNTIDELEELGFAARKDFPGDRRAYGLEPTPRGRKVLAAGLKEVGKAEEKYFVSLASRDKEELRRLLMSLMQRVENPTPDGKKKGNKS
jgi:DNA-binding MarR family transcriptional regulator